MSVLGFLFPLLLLKSPVSQTINSMVTSNPYEVSILSQFDVKCIETTELKIIKIVVTRHLGRQR